MTRTPIASRPDTIEYQDFISNTAQVKVTVCLFDAFDSSLERIKVRQSGLESLYEKVKTEGDIELLCSGLEEKSIEQLRHDMKEAV